MRSHSSQTAAPARPTEPRGRTRIGEAQQTAATEAATKPVRTKARSSTALIRSYTGRITGLGGRLRERLGAHLGVVVGDGRHRVVARQLAPGTVVPPGDAPARCLNVRGTSTATKLH